MRKINSLTAISMSKGEHSLATVPLSLHLTTMTNYIIKIHRNELWETVKLTYLTAQGYQCIKPGVSLVASL